MPYFIFFLLASTLLLPCCAQNTAGVTIPAQQKFILGEYMERDYTAKMENQGQQDILVSLIKKDSREVAETIELESGTTTKLTVDANYEVHLRNSSNKEGLVLVQWSATVYAALAE